MAALTARLLALPLVASAAAACTDFATPAELTRPTILAVTAEPPIVAPGAQAELAVAIADASGPLTDLPVRWSLVETYPGVAPMGTLDGATYNAPDPVPALPPNAPPIDSVRLEIDTPERTLVAIKVVPVAAVEGAANPAITALAVGPDDGLAGPLRLARGEARELVVTLEPPAGEDARYAWYSSAGTIEAYQSNPTTLVAAEDATEGWLFVVVRDGRGGVAWRGVEVTVE